VKEIQKYDQPEWLPGLKSSDLTLKNRAFQAMMDVWQKQIYSHLLHLLGNHDDADDATQETFIQLLKSIESFEERSKFSTWLYTIAHRKGIECLRKRSKIQQLFTRNETKQLDASAAAPASNLSEAEIRKLLEEAVQQLPTRQREVFLLRHFEGLRFRQIATITGVSDGALKASYHHARKKIENILKRYDFIID
jgi:RNA polymerase sigma-70 factor (ECF subfamily)